MITADNFISFTKANQRGFIIPRDGNRLIVGDYSAIEARVVGWIAGDSTMLRDFADFDAGRGEEPYILMAAQVFATETKDVTKSQRQLGKGAVLGCGFQMGGARFAVQNKVDEVFGAKCVSTYRQRYYQVPRFWYALQAAVTEAVTTGKVKVFGRLKLVPHQGFLYIKLPSGRNLAYYRMGLYWSDADQRLVLSYYGVRQGETGTKGYGMVTTYGGKLTENIVQAIARDIMAAALVRLDKAGFFVVGTVHDEAITDEPNADERLDEFITLMEEAPDWADGLPIKVNASIMTRYGKD